jgi:hypothetical protein
MNITYTMTVSTDHESDMQPIIASLERPDVLSVAGIDTDRVRVTLVSGANVVAFEAALDADDDVKHYERE